MKSSLPFRGLGLWILVSGIAPNFGKYLKDESGHLFEAGRILKRDFVYEIPSHEQGISVCAMKVS